MAVYAIGDVQGCYDELRRLLDDIGFDPASDTLWFTGDLVNRGPRSLAVLRYVRDLGAAAVTVLGNHDLHLLACAEGYARVRSKDTLGRILKAADRADLLDWLAHRPLLHSDASLGWTMVHAGLPPQWDVKTAAGAAQELEAVLRSPKRKAFFAAMYGDAPRRWSASLKGFDRLRFVTNCLTRMRFCSADGTLDMALKGPPNSAPDGWMPWFRVPGRASEGQPIVFGHWSTLGPVDDAGVLGLDTGCVWGGCLTAARLDGPGGRYSIDCGGALKPGA